MMYSTFLGGAGDEEPRVVLEYNNAPIVIGWTRSGNFPVTPDADGRSLAGGQDIFVTVFPDLMPLQLSYSGFIGTLRDERPLGATVDLRGDFYIAGETNSGSLCQVVEGFQNTYGGGGTDAFVLKYVRVTLMLLSPRGGERFCAGSVLNVSWLSSGTSPVDTFRVELSLDRQQWTAIGVVTGTSYMWTIPAQQAAGRYWLRIVHVATGLSDVSDSVFTIAQSPSITQQPPDSVRTCVGDTLVLQVSAVGDSLSYQWYKGSSPIPGAQQPVLRLPVTSLAQAGQYSVRVRGVCPPELTSRVSQVSVDERPRIAQHPQDVVAEPGRQACFTVAAVGGTARRYQWLKDGVAIPGAGDTVYCIPSISAADSGLYQCVVWNRCGSDTSIAARLQVTVRVEGGEMADSGLQLLWLPSSLAPQSLRIVLSGSTPVGAYLYSMLGQPVAKGIVELSVAALPSGVYWLVVEGRERRWTRAILLVR
ncbi:MAG: immunoglobulin domain-containing protein [Bacteroidota bacterium]|nr:immunoglobulin domain-containing protein [Bacteroidota bacterium]